MPNPSSVLIVNPRFDVATEFTNLWTKEVISEASNLGLNATALEDNDARLSQFQSAIASNDPLFVYAAGHGIDWIYTGQGQEDILWTETNYPGYEHTDSNVSLVGGRVIYLLSCLTGRALGPAIAAQPNTYFIGYKEDFIFAGWNPGDVYSESFKAATNEIAKSLLRGSSIEEAYNAGIAKFDEEIARWQESSDPSAPFIVSSLLHDRDALIIFPGMPVPPPTVPARAPLIEMVTAGYGAIVFLAFV